jgi:hypothetical protein
MLAKIKSLKFSQLLILLLAADLFFIFFHILHKAPYIDDWFPIFDDGAFSISQDLGIAEGFQYIQEFWIVLLLGFLTLRYHKKELGGWTLLFTYLLCDDMFRLHEKTGDLIAAMIGHRLDGLLFANLQVDDIGELLGVFVFGLVFALILIPTYLRLQPEARAVFRTLTWMLAALLFFGIGLDLLDRFADSYVMQELFKLIEDGGEMLAMSVICWYAYSLTAAANEPLPA